MKAYSAPLASLPKVNAAITVQDQKIEKGTLRDYRIDQRAPPRREPLVVNCVTFTAALRENQGAVGNSWKRDPEESKTRRIPWERMFSQRGEKHYPKDSVWSSAINYAVLGQDIDLDAENILLPKLNGLGPYQPHLRRGGRRNPHHQAEHQFPPGHQRTRPNRPATASGFGGGRDGSEENAHVRYHAAATGRGFG